MSTTPLSEAQALPGIAVSIRTLRDQRAILDSDLAALYGVETKRFNEQVKRNLNRFPRDFMFQLTADEMESLRSQFATLNKSRGQHRKYLPYAFTEHGAIMAAMVLGSERAVEVSVHVVRAFVQLRQGASLHGDLAKRLLELEMKTKSWTCRKTPLPATPATSCAKFLMPCVNSLHHQSQPNDPSDSSRHRTSRKSQLIHARPSNRNHLNMK